MLLGTFVNEVWWPSCGKLRECTRVGYESAYRCHIQPKWAGVDMESITANDIEEWLGSFNPIPVFLSKMLKERERLFKAPYL